MYYYSHMKFENEIVLNIHCYIVEIQNEKPKHKTDSGEEVERGLKHREGNHDEDLMCRPRAEMNASPPEQLPPIPAPSHPPPLQQTLRDSFSLLSRLRLSFKVPAVVLRHLQSARFLYAVTRSLHLKLHSALLM